MKRVRIEKTRLIKVLKANAEKHKAEYEAAFKVWRERQIETLRLAIARLDQGDGAARTWEPYSALLERPTEHSVEYTRALAMLEMSADTVIELEHNEYVQYVEDEWAWQRAFKAATTSYLGRRS